MPLTMNRDVFITCAVTGSGGTQDAGLLLVSYGYFTAFTLGNFGSAAAMSFTALPLLLLALFAILSTGRARAGKTGAQGLRQGWQGSDVEARP